MCPELPEQRRRIIAFIDDDVFFTVDDGFFAPVIKHRRVPVHDSFVKDEHSAAKNQEDGIEYTTGRH